VLPRGAAQPHGTAQELGRYFDVYVAAAQAEGRVTSRHILMSKASSYAVERALCAHFRRAYLPIKHCVGISADERDTLCRNVARMVVPPGLIGISRLEFVYCSMEGGSGVLGRVDGAQGRGAYCLAPRIPRTWFGNRRCGSQQQQPSTRGLLHHRDRYDVRGARPPARPSITFTWIRGQTEGACWAAVLTLICRAPRIRRDKFVGELHPIRRRLQLGHDCVADTSSRRGRASSEPLFKGSAVRPSAVPHQCSKQGHSRETLLRPSAPWNLRCRCVEQIADRAALRPPNTGKHLLHSCSSSGTGGNRGGPNSQG